MKIQFRGYVEDRSRLQEAPKAPPLLPLFDGEVDNVSRGTARGVPLKNVAAALV